MLKFNKILNIISVILIFIILYSIFNNTIYFKKFENFSEIIDNFEEKDIYKKCPRGCGHHKSVPNCNECGEDKPDYDTATIEERSWLNKYHKIGDDAKMYAINKIKEWKEINPKTIFRFTFLYNKNLHSINIHPDYQIILYARYNPEKDNTNIYNITKWTEKLQLNLNNYSDLQQIDGPNNWTYIDVKPESWVDEVIYELVMNNNLGSNEFYKGLEKSELEKYKINTEYDVIQNPDDIDIINNKKKKAIIKIFDACDINNDNKISNGEEFRYLSLALNNYVRNNEKEEAKKLCKNLGKKSCDNLTLTELWDIIYKTLTIDSSSDWTIKENYISLSMNISINVLIDAIKFLEKKELLKSNHNIINKEIQELEGLEGLEDLEIKKIDRNIKIEETDLINFVSKLTDINKLLNDVDTSINWDERYKDVKERELTEKERIDIYNRTQEKEQNLKWKKYNISDDNYDMNIISERRIREGGEYLKNIAKPLELSHELAKKRWQKYYKDGMNSNYASKIIDNIKKGHGLHIDDIVWVFMYEKEEGIMYLNDLIENLENLNKDTKTRSENTELTLKPSCISKKKNIYTEIKLENNSNEGLEIKKEQTFWPIFSRKEGIDINENILLNNKNDMECSKNTICDKSSLLNNGIECMFISKKAKIDFDDKKPGEFWN